LIKSVDLKEFGNDPCLIQLIDEINYLEKEGLTFFTNFGKFCVYFILFNLLTAVEKSFVKHCEDNDVFLMTIDDLFDNNQNINFSCTQHKKDVGAYTNYF